MTEDRPIAVLKFNGPRFEDHGLDVDVLSEIAAYKRLLQETAKALWKRKHPDRRRLPKNFDAEISLKFFTIEPGSAGVPLVRGAFGRSAPRLPFEDELDEAAVLLQSSIRSLLQITMVHSVELIEPEVPAIPERPIWERLAAIGAAVPAEAWNDVPTDLGANVDRYLYGIKKGSH